MNLFYSILNHFPFTDQRSNSTNFTEQQRFGPCWAPQKYFDTAVYQNICKNIATSNL